MGIYDSANVQTPQLVKVAKGALTAGAKNAFAFYWQNPEDSPVIVWRVIVDVTTAGGTPGSLLTVGLGDTAATAAADLMDAVDLNAIAVYDNITDVGATGKSRQKMTAYGGALDYVTGAITTADSLLLAGSYYIFYTEVRA